MRESRRSPGGGATPGRSVRVPRLSALALALALASTGVRPTRVSAQASGAFPSLEAIEAAADSGHAERARRELARWLQGRGDAVTPAVRAHADFLRGRLAADVDSATLAYTTVAIGGVLPWAAAARLRLAQLRLARGQYDRALADLSTLRADFPGDSLADRSWAWTGDALAASGDTTRACQAWERAVRQAGADTALASRARRASARCPGRAAARSEEGSGSSGPAVGRWTVQLGAFSTREAAEMLRERAAGAGFQVRVVDTTARDGLFRVWTQEVPDAASADALRDRVARAGFPAITVQPDQTQSRP
ncbi:MAG: SPOR domain-containing protein [Candidatus Palauibacterales bacterium]|nr:SPOR domain-containing protein [Candidatus Palauibacterales bacterium]MDP2584884.1 SPOR domain-containing protein [Candidatus Palauibacterales bacterium]